VTDTICTWLVPGLTPEATQTIEAHAGQVTAVVGANGSGKSALGYWLQKQAAGGVVRRLIAHRKLWFEHAGPDITVAAREQVEPSLTSWSYRPDSRWLDHADSRRAGIVLFDLLAKVNERNSRVVQLVDEGATLEEIRARVEPSLLDRINRILHRASLEVLVVLTDKGGFDADNPIRQTRYPISQMSDGEKSALLLAAEVMAAPAGVVQIVDEPERHLHRSISAGLIEAIVAERPDCHFIVLTHDLDLAASLSPTSTTLAVLGGCTWSGDQPDGWDLHFVDQDAVLPEATRRAILGGRRQILFLEGEPHSLDLRLYSILFPDWTLMPAGGCEQVIRAVAGLFASGPHHWIDPGGIVDGDGRSEQEKAALFAKGVLSLPVHEVESLYYSHEVMTAVAHSQAHDLEKSGAELLDGATARALAAIASAGTPERLAATVAETVVQRTVLEGLPDRGALAEGADQFSVSFSSPYPERFDRLKELLSANDLDRIVKEFPIRDTAMRVEVAAALGFRNCDDYEAVARTRIRDDASLAASVRGLVGELPPLT
jgi:hypothetical protein